MTQLLGRCRKLNLSPYDLSGLIEQHQPLSIAEGQFLTVAPSIYSAYLERLEGAAKEDFDGLMWRAVAAVRSGVHRFSRDRGREQGDLGRLRFVLIDEFQDFSDMFLELIRAVREVAPAATVFCVGDDWQAINGFAGSDLRHFNNFTDEFDNATVVLLRANYRSGRLIVRAGNALMEGLGARGVAVESFEGEVRICPLDRFRPSAGEQSVHQGDEITPAVLRLVTEMLNRGLEVVLLARRNGLPWYVHSSRSSNASAKLGAFLTHVRSFLPEEDRDKITISTVHKYKGLEEAGVIVLDAVARSFPLLHPSWVFQRLFGDTLATLEAEERRLFYVATSRAERSLALVTERPGESPYLEPIQRQTASSEIDWDSFPPAPSLDGSRVEIRVYDGREVRDELKRKGYQYSPEQRSWSKAVLADVFTIEALAEQEWVASGYRIEVVSETGELLHRLNRPEA